MSEAATMRELTGRGLSHRNAAAPVNRKRAAPPAQLDTNESKTRPAGGGGGLDSLLAESVREAPSAPPRRARPRPEGDADATPSEAPRPARRSWSIPWRRVALAAASTAALVAVAALPRLRAASVARANDPTAHKAHLDGFDQWRQTIDPEEYLI